MYGQNMEKRSTISLGTGHSFLGMVVENADISDDNLETKSSPALQVGWDVSLKKWFSIGFGVSHQKMYAKYTNTANTGEQYKIPNFTTDFTRMNYSSRIFFHYANENRFDLYSGVRLGYTNFNIDLDVPDFYFLPDKWMKHTVGKVTGQLVLFGMRGYFTDHLGVGGEIALGAPHVFAFSVNGRF